MDNDPPANLVLAKLDELIDRVSGLESRATSIDTRLEALEAKGFDTKPIWERALAELLEVNTKLDSIDRRLSVLNDDRLKVRADQRSNENRLAELEQR